MHLDCRRRAGRLQEAGGCEPGREGAEGRRQVGRLQEAARRNRRLEDWETSGSMQEVEGRR